MIELNKIYNEDCLETMSRMEDGSVDCVATSNSRAVDGFAKQIKALAFGKVFIRVCDILHSYWFASPMFQGSIASYFRLVLSTVRLQCSQGKNRISRFVFNAKMWSNCFQDYFSRFIGGLVAIKWSAISNAGLFFVVPAAECFRDEFDCGFIDHTNLYSGMIAWTYFALTFVGRTFLDTDVAFAINQSGCVCYV